MPYTSIHTGVQIDSILDASLSTTTAANTYVALSQLLNLIYPVGSIYMSVNNVSPQTFIGGTWERIQDTFLLSAGNTYAAGATGGEANHILTTTEMPSHTHSYRHYVSTDCGYVPAGSRANSIQVMSNANGISNTGGTFTDRTGSEIYAGNFIIAAGGNGAHNNMPPYLAVYVWKRIA